MVNPNDIPLEGSESAKDAGSSQKGVPAPTSRQDAPAGETRKTGGADDAAQNFEELEKRFGQQGQELGEYRQFFQNIAPLLDKLDKAPELVQAIVDGKVDADLAKAVLEGKVEVKDAAAVQHAHEEVKKDMGKKAYETAKPEDITKMVETKVNEFRREFEEKADLKSFQERTQKFIEDTADFEKYSKDVEKYIDEHDVTDIEVAYYAVKGKMSEKEAQKVADEAAAERAKEVMANAAGGGQGPRGVISDENIVDKLISGRPNPNSLF